MFDFNGKQVMYLLFEVIEPKYFMLNGKNAFPGVTYENFLIDVINCSHFFSEKRPIMEHYRLVEGKRQIIMRSDIKLPPALCELE